MMFTTLGVSGENLAVGASTPGLGSHCSLEHQVKQEQPSQEFVVVGYPTQCYHLLHTHTHTHTLPRKSSETKDNTELQMRLLWLAFITRKNAQRRLANEMSSSGNENKKYSL